jgi:hypothetical protein
MTVEISRDLIVDRLIFIHDDDVTSAMIRSARVRWDLRVETYETEAELADKLRFFVGGSCSESIEANSVA